MQQRFRHIMVPVDFTEKNLLARDIAFDLAVTSRARLTLLHVVEQLDVESDEELEQFYLRLEERARSELDHMSQRFLEAGLAVDCKIRFVRRLQEILSDAAERQIDLIVMSSHQPDLDHPRQTWATLSYQVAVLCSCPVLLAK